jgi:uncharacterized small protein (TIGR04563 family)
MARNEGMARGVDMRRIAEPTTGTISGTRSARERGQKMSLYLPGDVLADIRAEARRQQRSISWLVRNAWRLARRGIDTLPSGPQWSDESDGEPQTNA